MEKRCSVCHAIKAISEFYKNGKNGHMAECKVCNRKRKLSYYTDNRSSRIQEMRIYRKKNKQKQSHLMKRYYQENKSAIGEQVSSYNSSPPVNAKLFFKKVPKCDWPILLHNSLFVKCKYCGKHFMPTVLQIKHRENAYNNIGLGESNFYCSKECTTNCPIFNRSKNRYGEHSVNGVSKERFCTAKQRVHHISNQCDAFGETFCERCGDNCIPELHHTLPVKDFGSNSINPAGHILLCAGCHTTIHALCA